MYRCRVRFDGGLRYRVSHPSPQAGGNTGAAIHVEEKQVAPTKSEPIVIDDLIQFSDPSLCELQPTGETLLEGLIEYGDGRPLTLGKVIAPTEYLPAFGSPSLAKYPGMSEGDEPEIEAQLPVSATWHGLTLVEIYSRKTNFSDAWSYTFRFNEPIQKVRSTLNKIGFAFAADGKQPLGNSETAPHIGLSEEKGQTSLDCTF